MKLFPYPSADQRHDHVVRHVFNHNERWWEIYGDLVSWNHDWHALRGLGVFGDDRSWRLASAEPGGLAVLERNHSAWLEAAEAGCDQAKQAQRVFAAREGRVCYVGDGGVTVYVAPGNHLATCFRPSVCLGSGGDLEKSTKLATSRAKHASAVHLRAAVRRLARRASFSTGGVTTSSEGEST